LSILSPGIIVVRGTPHRLTGSSPIVKVSLSVLWLLARVAPHGCSKLAIVVTWRRHQVYLLCRRYTNLELIIILIPCVDTLLLLLIPICVISLPPQWFLLKIESRLPKPISLSSWLLLLLLLLLCPPHRSPLIIDSTTTSIWIVIVTPGIICLLLTIHY